MNIGGSGLHHCVLGLLLIFSAGVCAGNGHPQPEDYLERGDPADYIQAAMDFLDRRPDSSFAPRVAFDLFMVATILKNQAYVDKMRKLFVLAYPHSLQARYFRSTFANAGDYRQLLSRLLDEFSLEQDPAFPKRFAQGLRAAMDDFGDPLLDDGDLALKSAYLLEAAGEAAGRDALLARLAPRLERDEELANIAALASDSQTGLSEKTIALHKDSSNPTARFLRDLFLFQMAEERREEPGIRQVSAEAAIDARRFAVALALLERQPLAEDGDKILFQRAWSHAALGQPDQTLKLLDQLDADYPDSPWRVPGRLLKDAREQYDTRLAAFADALIGAAGALAEMEAFEATLIYARTPTGAPVRAYLAMNPGKNAFETHLRRSEKLELAYRTDSEGAMLYLGGDTAIRRAAEPGPLPSLKADLRRDPVRGGFAFDFSANLVNNLDDFARNKRSFLASPFLATREGIQELLNYSLQSGYLLGKVEKTDGKTTLRLLRPDVRDPASMSSSAFQLDESGQLVGLAIGDVEVRDIRYGESDSMRFSPPEWPPLDTVMGKAFDVESFFSIIDNMARML